MFSGGADPGVANRKSYQRDIPECTELRLSSPILDPPSARAILKCMNAGGALKPVQRLADRLTDAQLESLLSVANQNLFQNNRVLHGLERTYYDLDKAEALDPAIRAVSKLTENPEVISNAIALFQGLDDSDRALLLRILQKLSIKMTDTGFASGLDAVMTLASSDAFTEIETKFRGDSPSNRSLLSLTQDLVNYLSTGELPNEFRFLPDLVTVLKNGKLFEVLDETLGSNEDELRAGVSDLSGFLRTALSSNGQGMSDVHGLFSTQHQPTPCLQGSKTVPDTLMHIVQTLAMKTPADATDYLQRGDFLLAATLEPFCSFPAGAKASMQAMSRLARAGDIQPGIRLLKNFYNEVVPPDAQGDRPALRLLDRFLGDPAFESMIPVMAEFADRGALEDMLFVVALPRPEDRAPLVDTLSFFTDPQPDLGNRSIEESLNHLIQKAGAMKLARLALSLRPLIDRDQPVVLPALKSFRTAEFINDAHPFWLLLRNVASHAPEYGDALALMTTIASYPEFEDTVRMTSAFGTDGRMKELLGTFVTLFHGLAARDSTSIHAGREPVFVPERRHNLSSRSVPLKPALGSAASASPLDACTLLAGNASIADTRSAAFDPEWDELLTCLTADQKYSDVRDALSDLRTEKTENGESYLAFAIERIKSLSFTKDELGYFSDRWVSGMDNGKFFRILDVAKDWTAEHLTRPLLDLARPLIQESRTEFRHLETFAASVFRRGDSPQILSFLDQVSRKDLEPSPDPLENHAGRYDFGRIVRWVKNKECAAFNSGEVPDDYANHRALQVIDEYENAVNSWEEPRFRYSFDDLTTRFEPALRKMGDPAQSNPDHGFADSLLNTWRYFSLQPGQAPNQTQHYTPEYLLHFMGDRSNDYRLISYYYPGAKSPRVRLVNSLDRLELVVINADIDNVDPITHKLGLNLGKKVLTDIALSWGDEPYEIWPKAVQELFPPGGRKRPRTLQETVAEVYHYQNLLEDLIGYPKRKKCHEVADPNDPVEMQKHETWFWDPVHDLTAAANLLMGLDLPALRRNLYNTRQVIDVIQEEAPGSPSAHQGGLKVLRDFFYELYESTPSNEHGTLAGSRNNLSFVTLYAKSGTDRAVSRGLRGQDLVEPGAHSYDPVLLDAFSAAVNAATAPELPAVVRTLTSRDLDHRLIWAATRQVFDVLDMADDKPDEATRIQRIQGLGAPPDSTVQAAILESARMKQSGFYLFATAQRLGIVPGTVKAIQAVLDHHLDYLIEESEKPKDQNLVSDLIRSPDISSFLRASSESTDATGRGRFADFLQGALSDPSLGVDAVTVFKSIRQDAVAKDALTKVQTAYDRLKSEPSYQQLNPGDLYRDAMDFLEDGSPGDPRAPLTSRRVREYLAERLETGDLEQILVLIQRDPDRFEKIIESANPYMDSQVRDLFTTVRLGLLPVSE